MTEALQDFFVGDRVRAKGRTSGVQTKEGDLGTVRALFGEALGIFWDDPHTFDGAPNYGAQHEWGCLSREVEKV